MNLANNTLCALCEGLLLQFPALTQICSDGYINWQDQCVVCDGTNGGLVVLFLLAGFVAAALFMISAPQVSGVSKITAFFIQSAIFQIGDLSGEPSAQLGRVQPLNAEQMCCLGCRSSIST